MALKECTRSDKVNVMVANTNAIRQNKLNHANFVKITRLSEFSLILQFFCGNIGSTDVKVD
jgi:hypothetical protein